MYVAREALFTLTIGPDKSAVQGLGLQELYVRVFEPPSRLGYRFVVLPSSTYSQYVSRLFIFT
jgi:hypothetical protein